MAFQVSPGVQVREIDLTTIIPAVSTTIAGFAGRFQWGPVDQRITVSSINDLSEEFQGPDDDNFNFWFTAANFLGYGNNLQVVRVLNESTSLNAGTSQGILIKNEDDYESKSASDLNNGGFYAGRYAGPLGNSLLVSQSDNTKVFLGSAFSAAPTTTTFANAKSLTDVSQSTTEFGFILGKNTKEIIASSGGTGDLLTIGGFGSTPITGVTQSTMSGATVNAFGVSGAGAATFGVHTLGNFGDIPAGEYIRFKTGATMQVAQIVDVTANSDGTTFGISGGIDTVIATNSPAGLSLDFISRVTVGTTLSGQSGTANGFASWRFAENFNEQLPDTSFSAELRGSTNDLVHTIVVDEDGLWTGTKGTVLETFSANSKASNGKDSQGRNLFYVEAINENSEYLWWLDHTDSGAEEGSFARVETDGSTGVVWGSTAGEGKVFQTMKKNLYKSLVGGFEAAPAGDDYFTNGYDKFEDSETVDVSLILGGPQVGNQAKSIVSMVDKRKDAVAFLSPARSTVLTTTDSPKTSRVAAANIVAYRKGENASSSGGDTNYTGQNLNVSSSYVVLDSGFKYMYDRFNDVFRYVPLNGDIAGIAVRSDVETETWFSPAGFNRGQLRDVVKLPFNPKQAERDNLYSNGINPVVSFPGQGTILFGDKTLQSKPSAFDRINVRRLFIVLEKAIATAAKFSLFELNDDFTRSQFRGLIEPFLADVQARRGITDFKVICDESNNTGEVIDRNEFVASIFIQPARSINFITLNFVATRTGVNFDEIAGVV
jgi:phage tail sheath protein FI